MLLKWKVKVFCLWCVRVHREGRLIILLMLFVNRPMEEGSYILSAPESPADTYFTCSKHELSVEYYSKTCSGNNIADSKNCRPHLFFKKSFYCIFPLVAPPPLRSPHVTLADFHPYTVCLIPSPKGRGCSSSFRAQGGCRTSSCSLSESGVLV